MKYLLASMTAIAMLCVPTPLFAENPAAGHSNDQGVNAAKLQLCYDLIESGTYPTLQLGECMSFNSVSEQGFVAHLCDLLRETDAYDDFGFTSYSDCIRNF